MATDFLKQLEIAIIIQGLQIFYGLRFRIFHKSFYMFLGNVKRNE